MEQREGENPTFFPVCQVCNTAGEKEDDNDSNRDEVVCQWGKPEFRCELGYVREYTGCRTVPRIGDVCIAYEVAYLEGQDQPLGNKSNRPLVAIVEMERGAEKTLDETLDGAPQCRL